MDKYVVTTWGITIARFRTPIASPGTKGTAFEINQAVPQLSEIRNVNGVNTLSTS